MLAYCLDVTAPFCAMRFIDYAGSCRVRCDIMYVRNRKGVIVTCIIICGIL